MKFIDVILSNSQIKEAKLFGPSKKASLSPETGVVIQNPAAYHVIKDSATMAHRYVPHYVFGHYANPFDSLRGKFTKEDIVEFVSSANSDIVLYQLLTLILDKIRKVMGTSVDYTPPVPVTAVNSSDPYGEYESYTAPVIQTKQQDPVSLLCSAFGV
jgi:hypothetical protein